VSWFGVLWYVLCVCWCVCDGVCVCGGVCGGVCVLVNAWFFVISSLVIVQ